MNTSQWYRCYLVAIVFVVVVLQSPSVAGDVIRGQALAERYCLRCHNAQHESTNTHAPSLSSFREKWPLSYLEEALAEGIITGHDNTMPEFAFSATEIGDLLTYLESLPVPSESQQTIPSN